MAITSLSTSSLVSGVKRRRVWDQLATTDGFFQIATTTLNVSTADVTFSNIPQNYTHLQLRTFGRVNAGDSYQLFAQFNGDTGSNYSFHYLYGNGSTVASGGASSQNYASLGSLAGSSSTAGVFTASVCDILDYTNTNKFKTSKAISGSDRNTTPSYAFMPSGNWRSTAAITSIKLFSEASASFVQYSSFALYGIKG
jgi:hypothetical protein